MKYPPEQRRAGFTLIEVLVVMAILVLLAGLVAPRVLGSKKKADINAAKTQIGALKGSLERYALDMNEFPTTEEGLDALVKEPDVAQDAETTGGKWDGPYVTTEDVPLDPWGNKYQYEFPPSHGKGKDPEIWSYGPDGQDETDDDIISWKKATDDGQSDSARDAETPTRQSRGSRDRAARP